ncbi:hypothetical protein, partial [Clostridium perfringens]|uniref:hypothetical protein n=1 Tax=Clostridium perfringens TaxID=1502 RepID=UPI0039E9764A
MFKFHSPTEAPLSQLSLTAPLREGSQEISSSASQERVRIMHQQGIRMEGMSDLNALNLESGEVVGGYTL